jgi:hypothetical protein
MPTTSFLTVLAGGVLVRCGGGSDGSGADTGACRA